MIWIHGLVLFVQVIRSAKGELMSAYKQGLNDCVYSELEGQAEDLGNRIYTEWDMAKVSARKCQDLCDQRHALCNSFLWCIGYRKCRLYDKAMDKNEKLRDCGDDTRCKVCYTRYKTCTRTSTFRPILNNTTVNSFIYSKYTANTATTVTKKVTLPGGSSDSREVSGTAGGSTTTEQKVIESKLTTAKVSKTSTRKSVGTTRRSETTSTKNGSFSKAENWILIAMLSALAIAAADH